MAIVVDGREIGLDMFDTHNLFVAHRASNSRAWHSFAWQRLQSFA
jgi:hypothetical protein